MQTAERSGEEEPAATSSTRTGRQRGAAATSTIRNKKRHLPFPGRARRSSSRILERLHREKFYREACKRRVFAGGLFSALIRGLSLLVVRRVEIVIPFKDELFWISPYKFSDVFACTFFPCCLVNPAPLSPSPPHRSPKDGSFPVPCDYIRLGGSAGSPARAGRLPALSAHPTGSQRQLALGGSNRAPGPYL